MPLLALLVALSPGAPTARAADERHDTVVILLDASGSMRLELQGTRQSRMAAAKSSLKAVLQKIPQSTHLGLLVFSAANLTNDWAYPLGPRDDPRLLAAIDDPARQRHAARPLHQDRRRPIAVGAGRNWLRYHRLLIVTDGEAQIRTCGSPPRGNRPGLP